MGHVGYISICRAGVYYTLHTIWADMDKFGMQLVALLAKFPDPGHWMSLLDKAKVFRCIKQNELPEPLYKLLKASYRKRRQCPPPANWDWTEEPCRDPAIYYLCLEFGLLLASDKPNRYPMEFMQRTTYVINVDQGTLFVTSPATVHPGLYFNMGNIPENWDLMLSIPCDWIEVCYAYTPTVRRLLLSQEKDLPPAWQVLFKYLSLTLNSPFTCFKDCLDFLQLVQDFLSGDTRPLKDKLKAYYHSDVKRELNRLGPLLALMHIFPTPSPFAAFRKRNADLYNSLPRIPFESCVFR